MIDRNIILNLAQVSSDTNEHLMTLYNIPVQMKAQTIVEIGAGTSTFALVAAANKTGGHVTSIDIAGEDTLNRTLNGKYLMQNEEKLTFISEDSLQTPIINNIDFLFLDSGHTYDLTIAELNRWFPHIREGGIIAMHDTAHEAGEQVQCRKALNDFFKDKKCCITHLLDTKIIGMSIIHRI